MNIFRSGLGATLALMLALPLGGISPAAAVPLDGPACEQLQAQLDALRTEGAAADMARGPEWARANLPLGRLQRIEALLEVEEQLNFRCGLAKSRITLPTTIEGGEEEVPVPGEATVEGAGGTVTLPQKAPPAPKPATASTTVPKTSSPKAAPAKAAAPKTRPKPSAEGAEPKKKSPAKKKQPQADDAYRPPPKPIASDSWKPTLRQ